MNRRTGRVPTHTDPSPLKQMVLINGCNLRNIRAEATPILTMAIAPMLLLFLAVFVFGAEISGSSERYLQYAFPGLLVSSISIVSLQTVIALGNDLHGGLGSRLRALPISGSAVAGGRMITGIIWMGLATILVLGAGLIMGFDPAAGLAQLVETVLIVTVFGVALSVQLALLSLLIHKGRPTGRTSYPLVIALTLTSSVYVHPESMPPPLRVASLLNPLTKATDITRVILNGEQSALSTFVFVEILISATAVSAILTVFMSRVLSRNNGSWRQA